MTLKQSSCPIAEAIMLHHGDTTLELANVQLTVLTKPKVLYACQLTFDVPASAYQQIEALSLLNLLGYIPRRLRRSENTASEGCC